MDWEIVGIDNKELAQQVPKILGEWDRWKCMMSLRRILEIRMETGWIHLSYNRMVRTVNRSSEHSARGKR